MRDIGTFKVRWQPTEDGLIAAKLSYNRSSGPGNLAENNGVLLFPIDAWTAFVSTFHDIEFERELYEQIHPDHKGRQNGAGLIA